MGVLGPIPWSSIRIYADTERIMAEEDFEFFTLYVRAMDREFLKHVSNKMKNQGKK